MLKESIHTESTFESAIIEHLTSNGWHSGNESDYDKESAFDRKAVLEFFTNFTTPRME